MVRSDCVTLPALAAVSPDGDCPDIPARLFPTSFFSSIGSLA
jgi:hypothetical protein